ncbi:unnamed protein product [Coffea canephora]|uniref:Beta-glucosidase n=1 Tax=Coffea canephora TaxID=49390 RepID=A0A068UGP6_COFCA|nr:unnamed protein product [Coffea canephora]
MAERKPNRFQEKLLLELTFYFHNGPNNSYTTDNQVNLTTERNGLAIGEAVLPLYVYPQGLRDVLVYTKNKYGNPTIYITENGFGETNITKVEGGVKDLQRARFYQAHLRVENKSCLRILVFSAFSLKTFFLKSLVLSVNSFSLNGCPSAIG